MLVLDSARLRELRSVLRTDRAQITTCRAIALRCPSASPRGTRRWLVIRTAGFWAMLSAHLHPAVIDSYISTDLQLLRSFWRSRVGHAVEGRLAADNSEWGEGQAPSPATHLAITPSILCRICPHCRTSTLSYAKVLWCATVTTCCLEADEITILTTSGLHPMIHLTWRDVANSEDHRVVCVFLKRSKTDEFFRGMEGFLKPICVLRQPWLRLASGHSFRIGEATAASLAGVPDLVIQLLDRWSSSDFLQYIRTSRVNSSLDIGNPSLAVTDSRDSSVSTYFMDIIIMKCLR